MRIGYARVSTQDQSANLQLDALRAAGCERIFSEKASGSKTDRPELIKALEFSRSGDTIVVWKLDRLARSMKQLIETLEMLKERGIALESLTEKIDTASAQGKLVFGIFAKGSMQVFRLHGLGGERVGDHELERTNSPMPLHS